MKPKHNSDPLDQQIDALLASRPLKPSDDFAARVLAQAEAEISQQDSKRPLGKLIKFALPLAAAIALTFSLLQLEKGTDETTLSNRATTATATSTSLNAAEAQEIFLLEDSLASLATLSSSEFGTQNLLSTLDALYLEI